MKSLIVAMVGMLMTGAVLAVDFETVDATVKQITVTSPELAGVEAWRQSSIEFVEGNPTAANCGGNYAFDEENASLALLLSRNKDIGVPGRMVIEVGPPGAGITCFVRRVTEL